MHSINVIARMSNYNIINSFETCSHCITLLLLGNQITDRNTTTQCNTMPLCKRLALLTVISWTSSGRSPESSSLQVCHKVGRIGLKRRQVGGRPPGFDLRVPFLQTAGQLAPIPGSHVAAMAQSFHFALACSVSKRFQSRKYTSPIMLYKSRRSKTLCYYVFKSDQD